MTIQVWDNPGKYLGLPSDWSRKKSNDLHWIKERVLSKVQGWKENILNQAGKEVLIKSVIQAIPTHAMAMLWFPKNFCRDICAKVARFWWSGNGKDRGIHWRRWDLLTRRMVEWDLKTLRT